MIAILYLLDFILSSDWLNSGSVLSCFLVEAATRMIIFSTRREIFNSSKLSLSNLAIFSRLLDRGNVDGHAKDF